MEKLEISWLQIEDAALSVARQIREMTRKQNTVHLYGVPRGGVYAALAVKGALGLLGEPDVCLCPYARSADFIVDDLIDSGATRAWHDENTQAKGFFSLFNKLADVALQGKWLVFPWEVEDEAKGPTDAVVRLLQFIGEDPMREGLRKTPERVIKSYGQLFSGYGKDPADLMTVFEDGSCKELVVLKEIEFQSCCEHHMLPFVGVAHVGYIPQDKVIGVSKLARLVDMYAKRLQIQERLSQQVTAALDNYLQPLGSACVIEAKHLCMSCRGVGKQNSVMVTSSLTGEFLSKPEVRQEFMSLIRSR